MTGRKEKWGKIGKPDSKKRKDWMTKMRRSRTKKSRKGGKR